MTTNDLNRVVTADIREYTARQNVAEMALRNVERSYTNETKPKTLEEVVTAFQTVLSSIKAIYYVLEDNLISQEHHNGFVGLEAYYATNTVTLMAIQNIIRREEILNAQTNYEDGLLALDLLMYDVDAISDMLSNNMEYLWEIKDKVKFAAWS